MGIPKYTTSTTSYATSRLRIIGTHKVILDFHPKIRAHPKADGNSNNTFFPYPLSDRIIGVQLLK